MKNEGVISKGQAACLAYGCANGNIVYIFTWVAATAGRSFWVAVLIGVLINIPFAVWILKLGKNKPGCTVFDILEEGLGKFICKIIIMIYLVINIITVVCMLNMFTGTVMVYFLENTPSWVLLFFLMLICVPFVKSGIKGFAYLIEILVVLYTINYFVAFSASFINSFKMEYITPIFDTSYSQFAKGVLISAGSNAECLLFFMIMVGSTPQTPQHYKSVAKGLLTLAVILTFAVFLEEGVLSQELLSNAAHAGISVSRTIQISSFIQGLEIFVLMTYQYIAIVKITIILYSCWVASKKLFNVQKGTPLLILTALLILGASVWSDSFNSNYFLALFLGSYVNLPFVIFVLILATISATIIKKRSGKQEI